MNHHMKELSTFIRCQSTQFLGAISLHPGNSYTVVLSPQETIRMPSPYVSNCTEEYPANIRQKVAPRSKYSSQNCILYCYDEIFVESCNCSYPFLQEGKETNIITQLYNSKMGIQQKILIFAIVQTILMAGSVAYRAHYYKWVKD